LDIREDFYLFIYYQGGEALAQVAQRGGRYPISGDIQDQAISGSEQLDLSVAVPVHCRELD